MYSFYYEPFPNGKGFNGHSKKLRKSIPEASKNDSATIILTVLSEERETGHCDQHGTY